MSVIHSFLQSRPALLAGLMLLVLLLAPAALADEPEIYTGFGSSLAVGGYDTVAYFSEGQPVKGSMDFTLDYKGATWRFSSQENLEAFEQDPDAFAPQYGGYCAWAMAMGNLAKGAPKVWTLHEGRLYLNISRGIQKKWEKDIPGFIEKADANWPGILAE